MTEDMNEKTRYEWENTQKNNTHSSHKEAHSEVPAVVTLLIIKNW